LPEYYGDLNRKMNKISMISSFKTISNQTIRHEHRGAAPEISLKLKWRGIWNSHRRRQTIITLSATNAGVQLLVAEIVALIQLHRLFKKLWTKAANPGAV